KTRRKSTAIDVNHERTRVQDHDEIQRQRRGVLRDRGHGIRICEVVPRDVDGIAVPVLDRPQRLRDHDRVGARDGDKGPLPVRLDESQRPAGVEMRIRRHDKLHSLAGQRGAHEIAKRSHAVRPRIQPRQTQPGRGREHVERPSRRHPALRGEDVPAPVGERRNLEDEVDDHAAQRDEPLDHRRRSLSRRSTRDSNSMSLTSRTFCTASGGRARNPVQAPTMAPARAAMVSVSPPRAAAWPHASHTSPWLNLATPNAVGTDSAVSTPVPNRSTIASRLPSLSASSNRSAKPKRAAARSARDGACPKVSPPPPADTPAATAAAPAWAMSVSWVTRYAETTAARRR